MHSGWAWWSMAVGMLVFWGLITWVAVTLLRRGDRGRSGKGGDAQEILDDGYARGDIGDHEHRRRTELIHR